MKTFSRRTLFGALGALTGSAIAAKLLAGEMAAKEPVLPLQSTLGTSETADWTGTAPLLLRTAPVISGDTYRFYPTIYTGRLGALMIRENLRTNEYRIHGTYDTTGWVNSSQSVRFQDGSQWVTDERGLPSNTARWSLSRDADGTVVIARNGIPFLTHNNYGRITDPPITHVHRSGKVDETELLRTYVGSDGVERSIFRTTRSAGSDIFIYPNPNLGIPDYIALLREQLGSEFDR